MSNLPVCFLQKKKNLETLFIKTRAPSIFFLFLLINNERMFELIVKHNNIAHPRLLA